MCGALSELRSPKPARKEETIEPKERWGIEAVNYSSYPRDNDFPLFVKRRKQPTLAKSLALLRLYDSYTLIHCLAAKRHFHLARLISMYTRCCTCPPKKYRDNFITAASTHKLFTKIISANDQQCVYAILFIT